MKDLILLNKLPANLSDYEVASADLSFDYWTPEKEGEIRRMFFMGLQPMDVPDHSDPEKMVSLECAVFVEVEDSEHRTIVNGSVRLRSIVESLDPATPVQVTYRGKKKNRSNGNMSDQWSVVTLKPKEKS